MAVEIADLIAERGLYYRAGGQSTKDLIKKINRMGVTEQFFGQISTDSTLWEGAETAIGRILQAFQSKVTVTGDVSMKPISIGSFRMKADLKIDPDKIEDSWAGFLADANLDRRTWPLIKYILETLAIPQLEEDYEMLEIFFGERAEPADGVVSAAGTAMDGIRKQIRDAVDDTKVTPFVMGALPTTALGAEAYIRDFCKRIPLAYRHRPAEIFVNEDFGLLYAEGREEKYGKNTNATAPYKAPNGETPQTSMLPVQLHPTKSVVVLPSMGSSPLVWSSPAANRKRLVAKTQNMTQFRLQEVGREVLALTDFRKGVGFLTGKALWTNDQDLS